MSIILFRIYEVSEPLDKYTLIDLFHVENVQFITRTNKSSLPWHQDKNLKTKVTQSFIKPIYKEEIVSEYITDKKNSDGYIIYLNDFFNKRSYKKANMWLNNLFSSHIELVREMGWEVELFLGYNPQGWISKKFEKHAERLDINVTIL